MDPLSIAASSSAIAGLCFKVAGVIFRFVDDTRTVDSSVSDLLQEILGLSRVCEAISQTWTQHPMIVTAETSSNGNLWASVKASIDDCKNTLGKLDTKLEEVQTLGFLGRGLLRKPTKLVKLNMKMKDILLFKQQVHSYNNAMQSALQMINVCLLLHNNSSQESIAKVLAGLKSQIGRVESALQERGDGESSKDGIEEENARIRRNLQGLVQAAESFHSNTSVILSDGARSTVWSGSVIGEPLSAEQHRSIRDWIPPPIIEESEHVEPDSSVARAVTKIESPGDDDKDHSGKDSDADSDDLERQLTMKFEELAMKSLEQKDFEKAETFLRKLVDRGEHGDTSSMHMTSLKTWLAYACGSQDKWEEAESILVPIAMAKGTVDVMALHGMNALALVHLRTEDYDAAIRYCKRAIWGLRKFRGKTSPVFYESMALLARIYEIKGDSAEAEGCRSLILYDYSFLSSRPLALEPLTWIETVLVQFLPSFPNGGPLLQAARTVSGGSFSSTGEQGTLASSSEVFTDVQLESLATSASSFTLPSSSENSESLINKGQGHSRNPFTSSGFKPSAYSDGNPYTPSNVNPFNSPDLIPSITPNFNPFTSPNPTAPNLDLITSPNPNRLSAPNLDHITSPDLVTELKQPTPLLFSHESTTTEKQVLKETVSDMLQKNDSADPELVNVSSSAQPDNGVRTTDNTTESLSIRFFQYQGIGDPYPFEFSPISRTLPTGKKTIRIRRYYSNSEVESTTPTGDVCFKSKVVSRKHCVMWCEDGQCYIKDVQSASGTFLNDVRLSPAGTESKPFPIGDGDIIQLGVTYTNKEEDMIFRCVKIRIELYAVNQAQSPDSVSSTSAIVAQNTNPAPPVSGVNASGSKAGWFKRHFP